MVDEEILREIRKAALQNALAHEGKTKDKIILSKLLATNAELRSKAKEIMQEVSEIVKNVNQMSVEEQREEIKKEFPEILKEQEEKRTGEKEESFLPPLEDAQHGKVVTRFPPEPNGYPHIGHAKAAIINEEYAKMYEGKKILRMDDTNPESERLEYYAAIKVGLEWLGIKYDTVKNTSDDIELLYQKGKQMIDSGKSYICTCKREEVSRNRRDMKSCKCSFGDIADNQDRWKKMFEKYKEGEAVMRFRGDMESENTVMRDPVLFRIIEEKHPIVGDKYRVWPSYDFAVAVEDSIDGVTHAFRSKEYELRNELYDAVLEALSMRKPKMLEFSRLEFKGMPVSKRILRPLIEEGKVSWYDDPRLPTLEGLKRRGIRPEAVRKFILSLGFTKSDTLAPFDALESFNRKIVDAESVRLFMVRKPRKITISDLPVSEVELPNHPTADRGTRKIAIGDVFFIEEEDAKMLQRNSKVRLMGLGNVKITDASGHDLKGVYTGDELIEETSKVQWVPQTDAHKIKLLIPHLLFTDDEQYNESSLEELEVYTEPYYLELKEGVEIQFVRFGYCRKDSQNQVVFTHK